MRLTLVSVLCGSVLAGCSTSGPGADGPELQIPDEPRSSIREEYRSYRADDTNLHNMQEKLIADCMKKQTFTYVPELVDDDGELAFDVTFALTVDEAEGSGYATLKETDQVAPNGGEVTNPGRDGLNADESVAWDIALSGRDNERKTVSHAMPGDGEDESAETTLGGCTLTTIEQLYGSLETEQAASFTDSNLSGFALNASADDSELIDLNSDWSSCMDEAGWGRAKLGTALEYPESAQSAATEYPDWESDLSLADATCQEETVYATTRTRVEDRYLTAVADFYEPEITAALDIKKKAQETGRALGL